MTTPAPASAAASSGGGRTHFDRGHRTMRYRPDTGFEAKCLYCTEWWPITLDYWKPRGGMQRCAACWRLYKRLHEAGRRADDLVAEAKRAANRVRYHANRHKANAAAAAWRARNKERISAYNRAYRARNVEKIRAQSAAYYAEARPVILAKKRAAHRGELAA